MPRKAAIRLLRDLPELALDESFDRNWIRRLKRKVNTGHFEFTLPVWMVLKDATGNPLDATEAAVDCFEACAETTAWVAAYSGGAAAGGGGGAGGGGAGGGGGGAGSGCVPALDQW